MKKSVLFFFVVLPLILNAQQITVQGVVSNEKNIPIQNVAVSVGTKGTETNAKGFYSLTINSSKQDSIKFKHIGYKTVVRVIPVTENAMIVLNMTLEQHVKNINTVEIEDRSGAVQGEVSIDVQTAGNITAAQDGIEAVLLTLPGVNNANELSSQYNVRGGNFDENLVYINGIEIYRPYLVRSGQQEGLSIVNKEMVNNVRFSAGGFQARFGDKMSSVLDIIYKNPMRFGASADISLLGGSITLEGADKQGKFFGIAGIRYRDNGLFIDMLDTDATTDHKYTDLQTYLSWRPNKRLSYNFLGHIASNNYNFIPKSRQTNFGTLSQPRQVNVYYEGREKDLYETYSGAFQINYKHADTWDFQATANVSHGIEKEYYDIASAYFIEEFGNVGNGIVKGIGSQLHHARNDIDALVGALDVKMAYESNGHKINAGIKLQLEDIRDHLNEWEVIDSLGFSVRPPGTAINRQPYAPFEGALLPYNRIQAQNELNTNRIQGFVQYSRNSVWQGHQIWYTIGLRTHHWKVSGPDITDVNNSIYSLRGQFAIRPDWKSDYIFRIAAGMYGQPPMYKAMRTASGVLNPEVDAQQSLHFILSGESTLNIWNRPFKIESSLYYKHLNDLNAFTLDNVRLRYRADNVSSGYAMGFDMRLYGEFVPGTMSWMSIGLLKTVENIAERGHIPRPTDQRFKFALLFQDYIPNIPKVRMYLNLVYNSGLPGGSPTYANPYDYQYRLRAYKRTDIGINYVFKDLEHSSDRAWLRRIKSLTAGIEIFNMFDVKNSNTTTWLRDVYSKKFYGVPNYMTPRLFNVKISLKL